jgi:prevent-host-death family protein
MKSLGRDMVSISTAEAKDQLTTLVDHVVHHHGRIILTRRGKNIAALVPYEDIVALTEWQNKHDLNEALDALKEAREQGTVSLEQLKEMLGAPS